MARLPVALISLLLAASAAACGGASASPASSSAAPSTQPSPSAVATAAPPASTAASASPATVPVSLSEWKVAASSTLKAGTATFAISNVGTVPHEFLIFKSNLKPSAYPTDASGDIEEDGAGVTLLSDGENIDVGGSQSRTVALTPGKYLFVCNIPGHFKEGMFTAVTVTS
jgi:uncharacterized cupredoxin-like copper-binding protein